MTQNNTPRAARTASSAPLLGAHMSISGGFHRALERGRSETCDCVQIFTVSPRIWPVPPDGSRLARRPIPDQEINAFQDGLKRHQIRSTLVHASYLLNLASPDDALWHRSVAGLVFEMQRAAELGIPAVVLHPGAYTSSCEADGLKRIVDGLKTVQSELGDTSVSCLLENTAGQGSQLGNQFEHLAEILDGLASPERFGICLDTCHLFAAGYAVGTAKQYRDTMRQLDQAVGLQSIQAIHLNDSKQPLGSRKDRHEHIGQGEMGLEPFRLLLNDRRFRKVPMYLETPKGKRANDSWDRINLDQLRQLKKN